MTTSAATDHHGNVVISGISCRLPESDNMQEFRDNLINNIDMVTEEARRWKPGTMGLPKRSGTLKDLSKFDATFFGVHPRQADIMDPQIRNLLEISYEAIVDAGVNPDTLRGSKVGVFVGAQESETHQYVKAENSEAFVMTGNSMSMFSNRLSFFFDFKGPSVTVDTACSSALYALDVALRSIRSGECDAALVGGSCVCLMPKSSARFLALGVLSPGGKCRSFDKDGDGYCRSEGITALFLQKQEVAKRVYCTVIHTKTNSDGNKTEGITFPSSEVQTQLLRETYNEAGIDPRDVVYVEAHATGTLAGDPVEGSSLSDVFCADRDTPLLIGSVKSNMGHCESASGIASIAKVIIAMEGNIIPANLHYNEPNPNIPGLKNGKLSVVHKNKKWKGGIVGVNSFGFGGANAHVILKSGGKDRCKDTDCKKPRLFVYGSRTPEGVECMLEMARKNSEDMNFHTLAAATANMPLETHPYRGFTVLNSTKAISSIQKVGEEKCPVWFVFSGMGSQWSGMGRSMMEINMFRDSIMKSDAVLKQHGVNLYDMIMNEEELANDVVKSFVGITSIQVALVDLLTAIGIKPDGIVGHSVGELGCAYADGSLTAEEAVLAAYWRGHCVHHSKLPPGGMAAVGLTWPDAVEQCPPGVVPACHNSDESVTVSGPLEDVKQFVEKLKKKEKFAKLVNSAGVAFHSYFMKDVAMSLKDALEKVIESKPRSERWISSSFPESEWSSDIAKHSSADYHVHNLVSPVLFHEALGHVPGNALVMEIAPHCLLQSVLKGSLGAKCCIVGLMKRNNPDNVDFLLTALGKCYQQGVNLDPLKLLPPIQFPVSRGTPMLSPLVRWDHSYSWNVVKAEEENTQGSSFEIDLSNNSEYRFLLEHRMDGRPIMPAAGQLVFVWKALANREGKQWDQMPVHFEDVRIHRPLFLAPDARIRLDVNFIAGSETFQVLERHNVVVSGKVKVPDNKVIKTYFNKELNKLENTTEEMVLKPEDLYKEFQLKGYEYGPSFQLVLGSLVKGNHGRLKWTGDWISFIDAVTHLTIMGTKILALPDRIGTLIIDPKEHQRKLEGENVATEGLPMFCDDQYLAIRRAGGVHYQNVGATYARRLEQKATDCESYRFIPNYRQGGIDFKDDFLIEYARKCQSLSSDLQMANHKNGLNNMLTAYHGESQNSSQRVCIKMECQDEERFSDPKLHSFLKLLRNLKEITAEANFVELARELYEKSSKDLEDDILLTNLLQVKTLKPCLDMVWENVVPKDVKIIELFKLGMLQKLPGLPPTFPSITKAVGSLDPAVVDKLVEEGTDIEVLDWEPGNTVSAGLENFALVVADNVLHLQKNIRSTLKCILNSLRDGCFFLVHEVTSNFHIAALLDGVSGKRLKDFCDLNERTSTIYCDTAKWKTIFKEEGLEVICEVSDNLLSSLFLLRKQTVETLEKQTFLDLTGVTFDWVDLLKTKLEEINKRPKGENLWLKAADNFSGLLGMVNCLRKEPGGDKIRCVLSMDGSAVDQQTMEYLVKQDLAMNVRKDGRWGSYRHLPIDKLQLVPSEDAYVNPVKRGDLSSLGWYQSPLKYESDNCELCSVHYASLNFRDVMLATGKLSIDAIPGQVVKFDSMLGTEFSGVDNSGRRVMGMVPINGIATRVKADKRWLWSVPEHWSLEEAATIPVVYCTAFYALVVRGNLRKGSTVLIHSGTGGVGQAAISIALSYGCKIFTTVGTPEKRQYLRERFPQLNDSCIFSSRDTAFELGIKTATHGRGVDIVLNSLSEEKLFASVRILAKNGKFLEIGKYDLANNSELGMAVFLKNISFHGILLDSLFDAETGELEALSRCFVEGIKSGVVKPLQSTVFNTDDVGGAFRYMAQGKHIGKVLIKIQQEVRPTLIPAYPRTYFYPDKTYIITGGLGGFGLELAQWLIDRGAKNLVLTSRSGVKTGYQRRKLLSLKNDGAEVKVSNRNICNQEDVRQLIKEVDNKPVGGVFHLAVVLKDAILENQTQDNFKTVAEPKVMGTFNLDHVTRELCRDSLDWFVAFSSTSCGYGHPGQSPYGFSNSAMERMIEKRNSDRLPGLAIQWGPVGDVGVFINQIGNNDTVVGGTIPQRIYSCINSLDLFLNQSEAVVCTYVRADKTMSGAKKTSRDITSAICSVLGAKDASAIDENKTLGDFGLDSLLTVEMKLLLESDYGIILSAKEIRETTIKKLKSMEAGKDFVCRAEEKRLGFDEDFKEIGSLLLSRNKMLQKRSMNKLNRVEKGVPMFILPGAFGYTDNLTELVQHLRVPVFGLQRTTDVPIDSIEAVAAYYVKCIQDMSNGGPVHLCGFSFGAIVAQEMAIQFQESEYDLRSVIMLDGSTQFTRLYTTLMLEEGNMESVAVGKFLEMLSFESLKLELNKDVETAAQKLVAMIPDLTIDEARFVAKANKLEVQWSLQHTPAKQYKGNIHLIKAERSSHIPGATADYGLSEFCTGKISVDVVPGRHYSFLIGKSGEQTARIINAVVAI